jgi:hypothetical protein
MPFDQARPTLPGAALAVAPWTDEDTAAGSIAATAEQMANYLRFVLALGTGKGAPVLSDAAAQRFIKPVTDAPIFGPKAKYGNGLGTVLIDGKPCFHHTGGMIAFTSSFHVDAAAGVACFASVNGSLGDYRPRKTTAYAVQLLRAVRTGAALPKPPDPLANRVVAKPEDYAGVFLSSANDRIAIALRNNALALDGEGESARLLQSDKDNLMSDHPRWGEHLLAPIREHGKVTGFWWGELLFGRDHAPAQPAVPDALRALAGTYLNRDPWVGSATILAQGDRLVVEGEGPFSQTKDGAWVSAKPNDCERFLFDADLNGRAMRLNYSGADLIRVF